MEIAKLILEYIKALAWPAIAVSLIVLYRKHLHRFLNRLATETEEINSDFLGLTAKFRKGLAELKTDAASTESTAKEAVRKKIDDLTVDQFRALAAYFFTRPLSVRMRVAEEIEELSEHLSLDTILDFASSSLPGERVAAGIAIGRHIKANPRAADDRRVRDAIAAGLRDSYSRVRYRFVEALRESASLTQHFADTLGEIARMDENDPVRDEARGILRTTKR